MNPCRFPGSFEAKLPKAVCCAILSVGLLFSAPLSNGATLYVNVNSTNPLPPFTDWSIAAIRIQDAVDAASAGDEILVTNGTYATGGRVITGTLTNRVAVDKTLTLRSVNGPMFTEIRGYQVPGITNSTGAVRGVYLTNNAVLAGFTIAGGATLDAGDPSQTHGGGIWCESNSVIITNCVLRNNSARRYGGGSYGGTLLDCVVASNSVSTAYFSGLGGGVASATLSNCTVRGNLASYGGGAASSCLKSCLVTENDAYNGEGGGAYACALSKCTLTGNLAGGFGGAVADGEADNCMVEGNSATFGGGTSAGKLSNCTIVGNKASWSAGGAYDGILLNCIVYSNSAPGGPNYDFDSELPASMSYCCTAPLPEQGEGNIANAPLFVDEAGGNWRLQSNSPCINAGTNAFVVSATDLDGKPRVFDGAVDMGSFEFQSPLALAVTIRASFTNAAAEFEVRLTADIKGYAETILWDFGDGTRATNRVHLSHAWGVPGDYDVLVSAHNNTQPDGVGARLTIHIVPPPIYYVDANGTNPVPPFASWAEAATNIQDAVDAASFQGAQVLVTNGVYATGGRPSLAWAWTVVVVTNPVTVRSVGGPKVTTIQGRCNEGDTASCVYLGNDANLVGFSVTGGAGPGLFCQTRTAVVTNCAIIANGGGGVCRGRVDNCVILFNQGETGGGAQGSLLNNCVLAGNYATGNGGAASYCELRNCTVTGNTSYQGVSGLFECSVYNSIVKDNGGQNYFQSALDYCCTTPLPGSGIGNFTNGPVFVDQAAGNFHLETNSPCINAGRNSNAPYGFDCDGNARIAGGTVDLGAYELQYPSSLLAYAWAHRYGLAIDGSADFADPDDDGMNNWYEWQADTDPTNALSVFTIQAITKEDSSTTISWNSTSTRTYWIERSITAAPRHTFLRVATNLVGQVGSMSYSDRDIVGNISAFYRVGVQP